MITFELSSDDLKYIHHDLSMSTEEGLFNLSIGLSSQERSIHHELLYVV